MKNAWINFQFAHVKPSNYIQNISSRVYSFTNWAATTKKAPPYTSIVVFDVIFALLCIALKNRKCRSTTCIDYMFVPCRNSNLPPVTTDLFGMHVCLFGFQLWCWNFNPAFASLCRSALPNPTALEQRALNSRNQHRCQHCNNCCVICAPCFVPPSSSYPPIASIKCAKNSMCFGVSLDV